MGAPRRQMQRQGAAPLHKGSWRRQRLRLSALQETARRFLAKLAQTDPEAARLVFESGVPLTMVPLEVTHTALASTSILQASACAAALLRCCATTLASSRLAVGWLSRLFAA